MEFLGNSSESEDEVQEQPHVAKTARVRELEPGSSVAELPEQKLSNMDVNKRMKLKLLEKYSKIFKHTTASPSKSTFPKKSGNVVEVESLYIYYLKCSNSLQNVVKLEIFLCADQK